MKEYQNLIGKIIIAVAIVIAGVLIANAIGEASGTIGSQIASALATTNYTGKSNSDTVIHNEEIENSLNSPLFRGRISGCVKSSGRLLQNQKYKH